MSRTGRRARLGDDGTSFIELLLAVFVIAVIASVAIPVTAYSIDAGRARHAAGFLASQFRLARQHAVATSRVVALVFDRVATRWVFRVCVDGNGNGLRRADIQAGRDTCTEGPYDLSQMFAGVEVLVDPSLPGPEGEAGSADPVRFGHSDIVTFSPDGTGTAGSLYVRSSKGRQYVVRVNNVTGRTRVLRYETGSRRWIAG